MRISLFPVIGIVASMLSINANSSGLIDAEQHVLDKRFRNFIAADSRVEVLAEGFGWAEGPAWVEGLEALIFSDVSVDKVLRWDETSGLSDYLFPSGHEPDDKGTAWRGSNGLAIDNDGNLILAQQSGRKMARMLAPLDEATPKYRILASEYKGKLLNSPNDLVVRRSGDIYFTDPPYGHEGFENSPNIQLDFFGVFRLTPDNELSVINRDLEKPNGVALSIDQSTLYVSNSETGKAHIIAISLNIDGMAESSRLFFDGSGLIPDGPGSTDGMIMHPSGYLFTSIPNGVGILSPEGKLLGKIALGQVTNLALDAQAGYLYITAPKRLMRLKVKQQ